MHASRENSFSLRSMCKHGTSTGMAVYMPFWAPEAVHTWGQVVKQVRAAREPATGAHVVRAKQSGWEQVAK